MAFDPSRHFVLLDVQLWETQLKRGIEYSPVLHDDQLGAQTRKGVQPQQFTMTDEDGNSTEILRVIVHLGLRGLHAAEDEAEAPDSLDERVLFELETSFAVVYQIVSEPAPEDFERFVRLNCVHNAWSFWRQHVFDTLKRASLPVLPVPLYQIDGREMAAVLSDE